MVYKTDYCLMQVKSNAECSKGSILQLFQPSFSYQLSVRPLFCLFLSDSLTQVLLYHLSLRPLFCLFLRACFTQVLLYIVDQGSLDSCACAFKDGSREEESQDAVEMFLKLSILANTPLLGG